MENSVITLRSIYKIKVYHFQPGRQANGQYFPWVKQVRYDANGNSEMILSQDELNSPERPYFIPEDLDIEVTDGTQFDLSDPLQNNKWLSIKDNDLIAPTRGAKDAQGNLFIDGNAKRYGMAELWVDIPGEESSRKVSKIKKITKAYTYIEHDSLGAMLTKCKLLGKNLTTSPASDVQDYLYQRAERNPDEIIELYEGGDAAIKLLIIDAQARKVITRKDGLFMYDDTILGATQEALILYCKTASNKRIVDMIKFETYPEMAPINKMKEKIDETELIPKSIPVVKETPSEVKIDETPKKKK